MVLFTMILLFISFLVPYFVFFNNREFDLFFFIITAVLLFTFVYLFLFFLSYFFGVRISHFAAAYFFLLNGIQKGIENHEGTCLLQFAQKKI